MDDPKFKQVGELQALIKKTPNDFFFAGWIIHRKYTVEDFAKAELFLLSGIATFEPAGEERGTKYDESSACPNCNSGAKQMSPLFLDRKRISTKKDIASVVSH
jgi:hypothetical protein